MSERTRRLQGGILRWGLRLLSATWRYREEIPPECRPILQGGEIAVVAFWHGRMLPIWYRFRGGRCSALVSASRDGELLCEYLSKGLRYRRVIRGSSSRGGSEALAAMTEALATGSCLITPDGPRGPVREAKPGALVAASRAGRRVMAAGWSCRRSWRIGSWDRMEIPYPFSRIDIRYCIFEISKKREEKGGEKKEEGGGATREFLASSAIGGRASSVRISEDDLRSFGAVLDKVNGTAFEYSI